MPRAYLRPISVYFLFYAAWAALVPFLPLFYKSLGFSGGQIGLLTSITPLVTLVGAPVWGGIADASRRHRVVLLGTMAGAIATVAVLTQMRAFAWLALSVGAYAFFNSTVIPLVDNSVLAMLGTRRSEYGKLRLWGAVGWGISAPLAGWLAGRFGAAAPFGVYIALMSLTLLFASQMNISPGALGGSYWKDFGRLLRDRRWWFFLLAIFLAGVSASTVNNYLFLFMAELNSPSTLMGLALSMATVSEVPALFFSSWLVRRLGARGVLVMALGAYIVRLLLYSIASAPWQILLIQLLHGLTFAAVWAAGVSYAHDLAPNGLGATAQGLFNATLMGLGGISGSLAGGLLLERFGGAWMYRIVALVVLLGAVVFLATGRQMTQDAAVEDRRKE